MTTMVRQSPPPFRKAQAGRRKLKRHGVSRNGMLLAALALWGSVLILSIVTTSHLRALDSRPGLARHPAVLVTEMLGRFAGR